MPSVVRYRSNALRRVTPYAARNRYVRAGMFVYNNRKTIGRMARGAKRAYKQYARTSRKRAKFSRKNIGEPVGTDTGKRAVVGEDDAIIRSTRTLYTQGLCDIPQGSALDERERRIANIRGFKICCEVKNLASEPLYVNVAVLSLKAGASSGSGQVNVNDFFRASAGPDRARDFGSTLTGMEFHCLPINTDRYTILKHKRYRLVPPVTGTTVSHSGSSYMNIDWWIPLKRQIRWDAGTASDPEAGAVTFVYWADKMFNTAGTAIETSQFRFSSRLVTYFKEPKN